MHVPDGYPAIRQLAKSSDFRQALREVFFRANLFFFAERSRRRTGRHLLKMGLDPVLLLLEETQGIRLPSIPGIGQHHFPVPADAEGNPPGPDGTVQPYLHRDFAALCPAR